MATYGLLDNGGYLHEPVSNDLSLFDDYRYNPMQVACEFSAMPGLLVDFLALDRSDIPENAPDPWQTAWLVAPSSAIFMDGPGIWSLETIEFSKSSGFGRDRFALDEGGPTAS